MLHPPKLEVIIKALGPRIGIDAQLVPRSEVTPVLAERYGSAGENEAEYQVVDGVAVIGVTGTLLKKESWMSAWSGCTSYEGIGKQFAAAVNDARVQAILLDIDSPGGETNGCFELSDFIYSARGLKPIYAVADDMALSAAYAIASAADKVYVTRTGTVGSVGVYALHTDESGWDEQTGLKYKYIHHGAKKVDGNPHEGLSEGAEADIQAEVDREGVIFESTVARNRKADAKDIVALEAGLLWAENAVPLLADEVGTVDDALKALYALAGGSTLSILAASAAMPVKGDTQMAKLTAAAAETDGGQKTRTCNACGKAAAKGDKFCSACGAELDPEEQPTPAEQPEEGKKAAAASLALTPSAAPLKASRTVEDIQAISALCNMAGCPETATDYLASNKSVAEVSEALTAARVKESESHMIVSTVNPNKGAARMQDLEAEAATFARQNKGTLVDNLYVTGQSRGLTKEQATARALEANPEVYEAFRARHNAGALVRQLENAGYQLSERQ
jgi:signal peptide peptidase SppA